MDRDTYLLHQVHTAKLASDVCADVASTYLVWRGRPAAGLLLGFVPAGVASAVISRRDLSALRGTRRGRYVLAHMPVSAQVIRLAGQCLAWRAASRRDLRGILLGHLVIVLGWSYGALSPRPARTPEPPRGMG